MGFDYRSLSRKYKSLTGVEYNPSNHNNIGAYKQLTCIILEQSTFGDTDNSVTVRDWCEDNFGDNWIYEWNKFYFKDPKDALLFRLRW